MWRIDAPIAMSVRPMQRPIHANKSFYIIASAVEAKQMQFSHMVEQADACGSWVEAGHREIFEGADCE